MLTSEDQVLLQSTVLPFQDRHLLSLLVHGLRTLQAIAAATEAPRRLPDRAAMEEWVALQASLAGDPGFQEAFVEQLCRLRDSLQAIAEGEGVSPLDLPVERLLAWVQERAEARLSSLAATPPAAASSPPPS
jgi:hypothetical protein